MSAIAVENRVCIVGAGPVGLSLALRLAELGIDVVVFDENPTLKQEGSKACLIQGDVLEILSRSHCAQRIYDDGVPWCHSNVYIGTTRIARTRYSNGNRFGPFVNISQYCVEQILLGEVQRRPGLAIEWSARVVGLAQEANSATVEIERDGRRERRRFPYVVACNGVRSNLRDLLGARWLGYRHTAQFLITDIKAKLPFPKERHFHFDPPFNRGFQVIMHPQPDDVWRIDWQLPSEIDVEADRHNGNLDRRIRSVIGEVDYSLEWMSVYRFQQRMVERFVDGRVIFAGDAAHALPPYGSRGMNSGIQDADNLAWKLALVMQGMADPRLLDTYHTERSAAAQENIDVTEKTIRFMVPSNPVVKLRRKLVFMLARRYIKFRKYVNSGTMARPHRYIDSPLVQSPNVAPVVGTFAIDADISMDGRRLKLRELLGCGFVFLYVGKRPPRVLPSTLRSLGSLPTSAIVLCVESTPRHAIATNLYWAYTDAAVLAHYEPDRWHLIRPDMHVAGIFDAHSPAQFDATLRDFSLAVPSSRRTERLAA